MNSSSIADVKASDRKGKSFIPSENRSANSDYTMIQNSKTYFEGSKDGMKVTSRWLIKPGLGDILDSTHSRTIQLVLLARNDTKLALIEQLKEQLDNIEFASIIDADKYTQLSVPEMLAEVEGQLRLRSADMLIVSSSDKILEAAKNRQHHTCRYRGANDLFGQIVTDYTATSPLELQDCIEALNGISFRSSVIGSR